MNEMNWLLFVVLSRGPYPIATVAECATREECEERGAKAERFNSDTRWYCVEKKP